MMKYTLSCMTMNILYQYPYTKFDLNPGKALLLSDMKAIVEHTMLL